MRNKTNEETNFWYSSRLSSISEKSNVDSTTTWWTPFSHFLMSFPNSLVQNMKYDRCWNNSVQMVLLYKKRYLQIHRSLVQTEPLLGIGRLQSPMKHQKICNYLQAIPTKALNQSVLIPLPSEIAQIRYDCFRGDHERKKIQVSKKLYATLWAVSLR